MMKFSKFLTAASVATLLTSIGGGAAWAGVSVEEAKQLGRNLTLWGAEKAGNKEGTIPEYTGGLPTSTSPPGFVKGSGKWPNPFADEKPLVSITAQNMDKYADKLSEASKVLLKRYPTYRIDVYPSHRTVNPPKHFLDATLRNATAASATNNGLSIEGAAGGTPFPIPKTGYEVMWNHMTRWTATAYLMKFQQYYLDSNGRRVLGADYDGSFNYPGNAPGMTPDQFKKNGGWYFESAYNAVSPPRVLGDCTLIRDNLDPVDSIRKAYQYSASTRRVRLAPDVAYDTPVTSMGGVPAWDESGLFLGKMDRFDFKLVGKKEMYIPYNNYDALYNTAPEKLYLDKHINPDILRWELHRVWVVEATLKPGLRHIYTKRMFYIDEDYVGAGASDEWDAGGKLYKGAFTVNAVSYDSGAVANFPYMVYDLATGSYTLGAFMGGRGGFWPREQLWPANTFTPDGLVARSKQ